jgi:predicted dehydrogenase
MPQFEKGRDLIQAGRIGPVHKVHLTWNRNNNRTIAPKPDIDPKSVDWKAFLGNAPDQPFDSYRLVGNWRWFWDFGGGILTDLMVHFIDVTHWLLDLEHPLRATTIGDNTTKGRWETPDTIQTLLAYPKDIQVHFEGTFSNARRGASLEFMGDTGTLYLDRGGYQLFPEKGKGEFEELILGTDKQRGRDFYDKPDGELLHLTNWVECVRSRKTPNAPAEAGVQAAAAAHLANQAYRSGKVVEWPA